MYLIGVVTWLSGETAEVEAEQATWVESQNKKKCYCYNGYNIDLDIRNTDCINL